MDPVNINEERFESHALMVRIRVKCQILIKVKPKLNQLQIALDPHSQSEITFLSKP